MFGRLFLLFVLVPMVELALLIAVGRRIGVFPTIAIVVATGAAGAALARAQGMKALRDLQGSLGRGEAPERALLAGVAVLVGGILLLTPGILTDLFGLALLLPWTRDRMLRWAQARIQQGVRDGSVRVNFVSFGGGSTGPGFRARGSGASAPGSGEADTVGPGRGQGGEVGRIRVVDEED